MNMWRIKRIKNFEGSNDIMINRLKSIPLWTAVLALIYLAAKNWLGIDIPAWTDISTEIIAILAILFGVTNNPTDKKHF